MPTPEHISVAELLLRKADGDLSVATALAAHSTEHDDAVGFHAQQAVEKALKAALALLEVEIPRTHDLGFLAELANRHGSAVPPVLSDSEWLSPWAVTMRYDDLEEALDREAAVSAAREAVAWAQGILDGAA